MCAKANDTVVIRNIYHMLAYALDAHELTSYKDVALEEFDGLNDLFAEILVRGMALQRKRGFEHGYKPVTDNLSTIRGHLNAVETLFKLEQKQIKANCTFDEYSPDTTKNRILKVTGEVLIASSDVSEERKTQIKDLLPFFDGVEVIDPKAINWTSLRYDRNNASYKLLMTVCYLILKNVSPTQYNGTMKMMDISVKDLPLLFEHFVLRYLARNYPELKPKAKKIASGIEKNPGFLPELITDITLTGRDSVLIIDTKMYGRILKENYGKESISRDNRNQIFSYVLHAAEGTEKEVSGMLLYAQTNDEFPEDVNKGWREVGHDFCCRTLDLDRPFELIEACLDEIACSVN